MKEIDIIERIRQLCDARGWTVYRLAKESGITYSTLCTMLHKSNLPSIPTLCKICNGFGITLPQFFDNENDGILLTSEQKTLLNQWAQLTDQNRVLAEKYIQYLLYEQNQTC